MIIWVIIKTIFNGQTGKCISLHCAFKTLEEAKALLVKENCVISENGYVGDISNIHSNIHFEIEECYLQN